MEPSHVRGELWFATLFDAHATALYRYFVRRLPASEGGRAADAKDLAADVLAAAWRRREGRA